jgi:hypothetical protein
MPQIDITEIECTTVTGYTGGLSYAIPDWAPDIYAIGNSTQEPYNLRASTDSEISMNTPARVKLTRVGPRSFTMSGSRQVKGEIWTLRIHYIGVGDLVRT